MLLVHYTSAIFEGQSVQIHGILLCNGKVPEKEPLIQIFANNLFGGGLMNETESDNGVFNIAGTKAIMGVLHPELRVYHWCDQETKCARKLLIKIPSGSVRRYTNAPARYSIGKFDLMPWLWESTYDCYV